MGRKKELKLQRKIEKAQQLVLQKESRKKMIKNSILLLVFVFAIYQVYTAFYNSKNNSNQVVDNENKIEVTTEDQAEDKKTEDKIEEVVLEVDENISEEVSEEVVLDDKKFVTIETNKGNIKLELYPKEAPKTVENFLKLAQDDFYDGVKFHRVISNFMIQTGDPLSKDDNPNNDGTGGPGYSFEDEINSYKVEVGSLAMANSGPNTNGSQFFIVTERAQPHLDGKHTVFGKVLEGMDVVQKIEQGDVMNNIFIEE